MSTVNRVPTVCRLFGEMLTIDFLFLATFCIPLLYLEQFSSHLEASQLSCSILRRENRFLNRLVFDFKRAYVDPSWPCGQSSDKDHRNIPASKPSKLLVFVVYQHKSKCRNKNQTKTFLSPEIGREPSRQSGTEQQQMAFSLS